MDAETRERFFGLACALSPECLCCDGELPPDEVEERRAELMAEWRRLEAKVGRKVTEDELWEQRFRR